MKCHPYTIGEKCIIITVSASDTLAKVMMPCQMVNAASALYISVTSFLKRSIDTLVPVRQLCSAAKESDYKKISFTA